MEQNESSQAQSAHSGGTHSLPVRLQTLTYLAEKGGSCENMRRGMKCTQGYSKRSYRVRFLVLLMMSSCLAGCSFDPFGAKEEVQAVRTSTGEDINMLRGDLRRIQEEVNNLSARFDRFSSAQEREVVALKSAVNGLERQVGQTGTSLLSEVDRKIAEQDSKRVADKNELVGKINSVVDQVNNLSRRVRAGSAPPSTAGEKITQKGFYYTVEEGDSLWGIASKFKEYGATVEAIRQANNMDSSNSRIVTGQRLFIPAKQ